MAITEASAIVIDSTSTDEERVKAINDFAEEIANMSGERIVWRAAQSDASGRALGSRDAAGVITSSFQPVWSESAAMSADAY